MSWNYSQRVEARYENPVSNTPPVAILLPLHAVCASHLAVPLLSIPSLPAGRGAE
jgi:hypothetical protein